MSDLIDREDIPYIDLNSDMPQSKVRVWVAFKEQIDALPSADAVEVVRCKDCRNANECHKSVHYTRNEPNTVTIGYLPIERRVKMTKGEVVGFLEKCRWWFEPFTSEKEQWNEALDMAIEALSEPKTGWIPVSERLPENSGCVLISIAGDIEFGAYDRQNSDWAIWRDGYLDEGKRADAWMPLPEPYREDGEA